MRSVHALLLLLLVLALLAGPALAGEPEDPLHADDIALAKRIGEVLPPKGSVATFTKALGAEPEEVRDLGFGASWRRIELYAEEVTCWIDVVAHGDRIAAARIQSLDESEAWKRLVRATWGEAVTVEEAGIEYQHEETQVLEAWDRARERVLGKPDAKTVRQQDKAAVGLLIDPLADLTFGIACYEDGSPPEGRGAADLLRLAGSRHALDHVLRGPNPEGRVYAAEALLLYESEGEALNTDRRTVINRVLALKIPIRCCAGCEVYDEVAAKVLGDDFAQGRVACRIVERVHTGQAWKDIGEIRVYWDGTVTRRSDSRGPGSKLDSLWRRGALPQEVWDQLQRAIRKGSAFLVQRGTLVYVHHLDDSKIKPPEGVKALLDHVDGTEGSAKEEGSPPR